jgi:tetratricopeptide (TPR) repeat protein
MLPLISSGQSNPPYSIKETDRLIQKGISSLNEDLAQSDSLSNIAYYSSIELGNDSLIAKSHSLLAYYNGDYKTSTEYYNKVLSSDYFKNKLDRRQALLNNLGVNYEFQNNYAEAKEAYQGSLQIAEDLGDSFSIYQSYINIGLY